MRKLLAVAVVLAAGCGEAGRPVEDNLPFVGITVRVACPDDLPRHVFERYGSNWADRTGANPPELSAYLLADPVSATRSRPDVVVIRPCDLGEWVGKVTPLPAALLDPGNALHWQGITPSYRARALSWGPEVLALPVVGEARVLVWREDRFVQEGAGLEGVLGRSADGPVATWQEYARAAAHFRGLPEGRRMTTPAGDDPEREFLDVAAPLTHRPITGQGSRNAAETARAFSFQFDLATGRPLIDGPGFVEALRLLRESVGPAGESPAEAFRAGRAALAIVPLSAVARLQEPGSPVRDRFSVGPLPGSSELFEGEGEARPLPAGNRAPYLGAGGWLAVVPKDAEHADAAFALLADLAGPSTSLLILSEPAWGAGPFRATHLDDAARRAWQAYDLAGERTDRLIAAVRPFADPPLDNPPLRLRFPGAADFRADLATAVRAGLDPAADPKKALADAAERWRARFDRIDARERRGLLRLAAGLQRLVGE